MLIYSYYKDMKNESAVLATKPVKPPNPFRGETFENRLQAIKLLSYTHYSSIGGRMFINRIFLVLFFIVFCTVSAQDRSDTETSDQTGNVSSNPSPALFSSGYGLVTAGFIFLGGAVASESFIMKTGKTGNFGGVIALGLIGGACEIGAPIMMSGGATKIERAYQEELSLGSSYNWTLYQVGLVFTIAAKVAGFLPVGKDTLYKKVEEDFNGTKTTVISYSPIGLGLSIAGQFFYFLNGIHAAAYISKVKKQVQNRDSFSFNVIPVVDSDGKYGLELVGTF